MKLTVQNKDDIQIIEIIGRLDGTTMAELEALFVQLVENGCRKFVFDLSELEYISSAGLRVMLLAIKKTRAIGGKLALFGLQHNVQEVFRISGFSNIFAIFSTLDEAVEYHGS